MAISYTLFQTRVHRQNEPNFRPRAMVKIYIRETRFQTKTAEKLTGIPLSHWRRIYLYSLCRGVHAPTGGKMKHVSGPCL